MISRLLNNAKKGLSSGRTSQAIDFLESCFRNPKKCYNDAFWIETENEFILLSSQFKQNERKNKLNLTLEPHSELNNAKISRGILSIIRSIENHLKECDLCDVANCFHLAINELEEPITQKGDISAIAGIHEIELKIDSNFDDFTLEEQKKVLNAIRELLGLDRSLKITRIRKGSIYISIDLEPDEAQRLLAKVKSGALLEFKVIDAKLKGEFNNFRNLNFDDIERLPIEFQKIVYGFYDQIKGGNIEVVQSFSEIAMIRKRVSFNYLHSIVSLKRFNDVRFVNKYLESLNLALKDGGYLIGFLETADQRRIRLMATYPRPLNNAYCFLDYWAKRVWPKLPYLKHYYFLMTGGRNRVISEMEIYGRFYSCGFRLINSLEEDGKLYLLAQKCGPPDYNQEATYGPLIKLKRFGKDGKPIKLLKFRTMYPYSEYIQEFVYENGLDQDPRINSSGQFMRKYWLDELPNLINLLKGEMKLFGVRPISRHYFNLYSEEFQEYRKKFKPGLIPPVYVEIPKSVKETEQIEKRYLQAYEKLPLWTDIKYFWKFIINVLFKGVRGS